MTFSKPTFSLPSPSKTEYKSERHEIISLMVADINELRLNTKYKPVTERTVAIKVNGNPFFKGVEELRNLYNECHKKMNYSKFWWVCK